ncbi:MAG: hypothetical protein GVY15_09375 [Bacteroidetes bacterium]|jgi:hypothetical protein|nr:hypothetical protein [Bacteroidota bacterium]
MSNLLAVDLGLKAGFAHYDRAGRLLAYRSQNYGKPARLKRGAHGVLAEHPTLDWIVLEGDRDLADAWRTEAKRRGMRSGWIQAHAWRKRLLNPSQRRSGSDAKEAAGELARKVIAWSDAPAPTALRHDAAEAICIGLWAVLDLGWLDRLPPELR